MPNTSSLSEGRLFNPGRVGFMDGRGEMPMIEISTEWSTAGIYMHGAHVAHFQKRNEPPLLFLSQCSRFSEKEPIRGGVPIIFPWFGPREGMAQHGFARVKDWSIKEFLPGEDGSVSVKLCLADCPEASSYPPFSADFIVTVNECLTMSLIITNRSRDDALTFENCLHTYFEIGDINTVSIHGLKGARYLDKVQNFAEKAETNDGIRVSSEVDRIYFDTTSAVEIHDPTLKRKIMVEKEGSASTVVWNPWITKAQQMPDFGNDEYHHTVCVESGNVGPNQLKLPPGQSSNLTVVLSSSAL